MQSYPVRVFLSKHHRQLEGTPLTGPGLPKAPWLTQIATRQSEMQARMTRILVLIGTITLIVLALVLISGDGFHKITEFEM